MSMVLASLLNEVNRLPVSNNSNDPLGRASPAMCCTGYREGGMGASQNISIVLVHVTFSSSYENEPLLVLSSSTN